MNVRNFVGALALGALMGLAVLAGGIVAQSTSAGAPVAGNTAQTGQPGQVTKADLPAPTDEYGEIVQASIPAQAETPAPTAPQPGQPVPGGPMMGGFGFRGHGFEHGGPDFGFGGPGFDFRGPGGPGWLNTADGANRVISETNNLITLVKGDLAYAKGKMDTANVEDWLNRADGLVKSAQSASDSKQYERAVATAGAARGLAMAADTLMQQALGADKLPSYNQRPFPGKFRGGTPPTLPDATQAQASRELAGFYNAIIMKEAVLKNSSAKGDADAYLTIAKDTYKKAYDAYQAGKYNDVRNSVMVGRMLLGVADSLLHASSAPADPNTPVQVPAPNF